MAFPGLSTITGSNAGRFRDRAPRLDPAGKVTSDPSENVGSCVKFVSDRPNTPDGIAPYRKSRQEVGKAIIPTGRARDDPPPDIRFGKRNLYNDSAHSLVQADTRSLFLQKQQELKENMYLTSKTEPLGQSRKCTSLPDKAIDPQTRFGRVTKTSENSKEVIYPYDGEGADEEQTNHGRYCKTHNSYDAGEQKKRSYDWNSHGICPASHRFGYVKEKEHDGVRQALVYGRDRNTVIVPKMIEEFKDVSGDSLGCAKNQGFGNERDLPGNFTFGRKNVSDEWGVKECVASCAQDAELVDKDLGASKKHNPTHEVDTNRIYGVPSVRKDLARPRHKKVTDCVNYGDDTSASTLLCPSKYAALDVHEEVC